MDNVEDIFDTLESNNVAFEDFDNKPKFNNNNSNNNFSNNQNFKNKFKKESLWDKTDFKPTLMASTICFSLKPIIHILSSKGVISEINLESTVPSEKFPRILPALRIAISVPSSFLIASAIKLP